MRQTLPEAAPGYRWELEVPPAPPRRRHPLRWIVALLVVGALAVSAWFAGEWLARDVTTKAVRSVVATQLGIPATQRVDVELRGPVLLQLMMGRLDDVTVSSRDAPLPASDGQGVTGDVSVHATGVSLRGGNDVSSADATVSFDAAQLQRLVAQVDGFPADTVGIAAPDVTMTMTANLFGQAVPVGVALTPAAKDGALVLAPAGFRVGEATIDAAALRARFGSVAKTLLAERTVCIARYVPAGMTLTRAVVTGDRLVASFDVSSGIVSDPALRERGTCG